MPARMRRTSSPHLIRRRLRFLLSTSTSLSLWSATYRESDWHKRCIGELSSVQKTSGRHCLFLRRYVHDARSEGGEPHFAAVPTDWGNAALESRQHAVSIPIR